MTHLNGTQKYWYDANGNQIKRIVGGYTYDMKYDAENRLIEVKRNGASFASFVYNGDGERVQSTIGGVVTAFVGNHLEWSGSATTMKKYYYAGSQRVAVRTGSSTLNFLLGDHLGSSSVTTSSTGTSPKYQLYKPFGEVRYTSSSLPTKYTFTGQYSNVSDFGLMYYGARWYDVSLGRFAQADTIIPQPGNPQSWDRFAYVNNSPVKYTDPSGHRPANDDDDPPDDEDENAREPFITYSEEYGLCFGNQCTGGSTYGKWWQDIYKPVLHRDFVKWSKESQNIAFGLSSAGAGMEGAGITGGGLAGAASMNVIYQASLNILENIASISSTAITVLDEVLTGYGSHKNDEGILVISDATYTSVTATVIGYVMPIATLDAVIDGYMVNVNNGSAPGLFEWSGVRGATIFGLIQLGE